MSLPVSGKGRQRHTQNARPEPGISTAGKGGGTAGRPTKKIQGLSCRRRAPGLRRAVCEALRCRGVLGGATALPPLLITEEDIHEDKEEEGDL